MYRNSTNGLSVSTRSSTRFFRFFCTCLIMGFLAFSPGAYSDRVISSADLGTFDDPAAGLTANAALALKLLGNDMGFPAVFFNPGNLEYVADTDRLFLFAPASGIQLEAGGMVLPLTSSPIVFFDIVVDDTGTLVGGNPSNDLSVSGSVDLDQDGIIDASGQLITGEVTGLTFTDTNMMDAFDLTFMLTGGALASLFDGDELRLTIMTSQSTFNGDWTVNWKGQPTGKLYGASGSIDIEKSTNGIDADDPNAGDAPQIAPGDVVTWEYEVTNTGGTVLENVMVTDDQGVTVTCPMTTLAPMESMTCTASGIAYDLDRGGVNTVQGLCGNVPFTPLYENLGTATGETMSGSFVEDTDPSHYCNPQTPSLDIEKATNGVDADDPNAGDAPQIMAGGLVSWTYVVTNTGNVTIENIVVTDDQGVPVSCPQTTLIGGEDMVCTASGLADDLLSTGFTTVPGLCGSFPNTPLYENFGTVTGTSVNGVFLEDTDPSHYCNPQEPAIQIEKSTNGVDADDPNAGDAPQIAAGSIVTWTYDVTNTGNVVLTDVQVSDDQGVAVSCPLTTLDPGQTMTCSASGVADDLNTTTFTTVPGLCGGFPNLPLYENMGTATGQSVDGAFVEDTDPSHYCNPPEPAIDIEKATNGIDADDAAAGDAPVIAIGEVVTWTYVVTNTGNLTINDIVVADDQGVPVSCPMTSLDPGDVMTCSASGLADDLLNTGFTTVPGQCGSFPNVPLYENMGQVTGVASNGAFVDDVDPSHYCNPQVPDIDIEKATNGVDADDPNTGDAPVIAAGDTVNWTYVVTNTGNVTLTSISVTDDQGVVVSCPMDTLMPGDVMTCTASGVADDLDSTAFTTVPGLCGGYPNTPLYENKGVAIGQSLAGDFVDDIDPSHYCNPQVPDINIEKATNGVDADDPNAGDAPQIAIDGVINWTYVVTNTGNVTLFNVTVEDDRGVPVSCPQDTLTLGEMMTCTGNGVSVDLNDPAAEAVTGLCGDYPNNPLYENIGSVSGTSATGVMVDDSDPSHYCNPPMPGIAIEKATNGIDADDPNAGDAPLLAPGDAVTWTYVVTNTGNVTLSDVTVTDDQGVAVSCPTATMAPGDQIVCTASGLADDLSNTSFTTVPGLCEETPGTPLYENMGMATGETSAGDTVQDVDPSHYCNPPQNICMVIIDEDGIDNGHSTIEDAAASNGVTDDFLVNDDMPTEVGNPPLRWNQLFAGDVVLLPTGEVDDEGWFALPPPPIFYVDGNNTNLTYDEWIAAFAAGTLPQDKLDKVANVMPLRNQELVQLVGKTCVAIVYDSDISMNYEPIYANLQGERYGAFTFTVLAVEVPGSIPESQSSTSLYDLWVRVEEPMEPNFPYEVVIHDHEPDAIESTKMRYSDSTDTLTVWGESDFAPNAYMTISVDGADAGTDPDVPPIVLEAPMTYNANKNRFEFVFENVGVDLDGRRFVISTDHGGSYNEYVN